jgi:hypothetical protein
MDQLKISNSDAVVEAASTCRVLVEVNRMIAPEDMDILTMFFESRRQSDGGEIASINKCQTKSSSSSLEIVYTTLDTAKRVLKRRFFSFSNYLLRASESGYQKDVYPMDKRNLILRNVHIDLNNGDSGDRGECVSKDYLIIKLYAEHLLPDNEIVQIVQSKIFAHTFVVTYAHDFDKEKLSERYSKKSTLRNIRVDLVDCYRLNAYIIMSGSGDVVNDDEVKQKLNDLISGHRPEIKCKYFIDTVRNKLSNDMKNAVIIQFDQEDDYEDEDFKSRHKVLIELMQSFCLSNRLEFETCHNFELLHMEQTLVKASTDAAQKMHQPKQAQKPKSQKKFVDKDVQTDLNMTSLNRILLENSNAILVGQNDKRALSVCSNSDSVIDEYESSQENLNGEAALAKKKNTEAPISSSNSSKVFN